MGKDKIIYVFGSTKETVGDVGRSPIGMTIKGTYNELAWITLYGYI